jgi:hypothetical protein
MVIQKTMAHFTGDELFMLKNVKPGNVHLHGKSLRVVSDNYANYCKRMESFTDVTGPFRSPAEANYMLTH